MERATQFSAKLIFGLLLLATVSLNPLYAQTFGTYNNTATATAGAAGSVQVTDISNDGTVLNQPSGQQTPINFPMIGLGKVLSAGPSIQSDGSYFITYTFTLQNFGQYALQNVQIQDLLSTAFPSPVTATLRSPVTITGGTGLTVNPAYDGTSANPNMLLPASSTLAIGASRTLTMLLKINLNGTFGTFSNSARATASTTDGTTVFDVSNNSVNPDGNASGNPFDDSTPTPLTFNTPDIQVIKSANTTSPTAGTTVVFTITAKNNGAGDAAGVLVTDLLQPGFSYLSSTVSTGTYNSGSGNWSVGTLLNGQTQTLSITATVLHAKNATAYQNTASSAYPGDNNATNNTSAVSLTPIQTPPDAINDAKGGILPGATASLNILANDLLSDGTSALISLVTVDIDVATSGTQNTKVVPGQGTWTYDPATGILSFTPIAGYTIAPTPLTYALTENATSLSDNATVTLSFTAVAPSANDDAASGFAPGTTASASILANDKLSDGSPAQAALVTVDLDSSTPGVQTSLIVSGQGTWTYNPTTGLASFVPIAGYTISPSPISYTLTEISTGLSDPAQITFSYTPAPPIAADDSKTGLPPGAAGSLNVLSNDKLSDGTPALTTLVAVDLDPLTAGTQNTITISGQGTWSYASATGLVTFTPVPGYTISPAPIPYDLIELSTGLFSQAHITFNYVPALPTALNDMASGFLPGSNASVNVLINDKLSDGSAATTALSSVDLDTLSAGIQSVLIVPGQGTWTYDGAMGSVTFDPNPGYTISPSPIPYLLVETLTGLHSHAQITLTYTPTAPDAVDDALAGLTPGSIGTATILSNDKLSDGSPVQLALVSVDLDALTAGIQTSLTVTGQGIWTYDDASGKLTFQPNAGFTLSPTPISYTLNELASGLSDHALVTMTYILLPPHATDDSKSGLLPGATASLNILANDLLSDGSPAGPGQVSVDLDTLTSGVQTTLTVAGQGNWSYNAATGNLTFTPVAGYTISPTPIPYKLTELATGLTAHAGVVLVYTPVAPSAVDDLASEFHAGQTATAHILSNDKLADGSPALTNLATADLDTLSAGVQTVLTVSGQGTWTYDPATGVLQFVPQPGFTISPSPIFYALTELSTGLTDKAKVTLTYTISSPVAKNDTSSANVPGISASIAILANDKLSDGSPAQAALVSVDLDSSTPGVQAVLNLPGKGSWSYDASSGILVFDPNPGYTVSPPLLSYTLTELSTAQTGQATVQVLYKILSPDAIADVSQGNVPAQSATIQILANDKLSDGSTPQPGLVSVDINLTVPGIQETLVAANQGTWTYNPSTGTLVFTPLPGYTVSPYPLNYNLTELATGLSDTATVNVLYNPLPPGAADDFGTGTNPGASTTLNILANDKLSDGTAAQPVDVTVDLDQQTAGVQTTLIVASQGSWNYSPSTGNVTFTPLPGYIGNPDPITYTLTEILTGLPSKANITLKSAVTLQIGAALSASVPALQLNGSYAITYTVTLTNYSNVALTDVNVTENLKAIFADPMQVTVSGLTASGPLQANSGFDGASNTALLGAGNTLATGETETITLTVNVLPNGKTGTFLNTVTASASSAAGGTTTDVSTNGLNPDPNGNGNPGDPGEDQPTPIILLLHDVIIPEGFSPNGDGVNDVFFIENAGNASIDLTIFNRWGNVVYKNRNYKNDWNGTCNTGLHVGENVPSGTYYYIAIIDGTARKVRYITINR